MTDSEWSVLIQPFSLVPQYSLWSYNLTAAHQNNWWVVTLTLVSQVLFFFFSFPNGLGLGAVYTMQKHKGTEDEHRSIGFLYNTQVLPSNGSMHSSTFLQQVQEPDSCLRAHTQSSLFRLFTNMYASQVNLLFQKGVLCTVPFNCSR